METQPLVSFILPVCNNQEDLSICLTSLLHQTYPTFEVIAVDDHSKDGSWKILRRFRKLDTRIKIYRNVKRYGIAMTLNRAIRRSKGQLITFVEPTNYLDPQHTALQLQSMSQHSKVVATTTQCSHDELINQAARTLYSTLLTNMPLKCYVLTINRLLIPKDLLYFKRGISPLIYYDVFKNFHNYGDIVQLSAYLHSHKKFFSAESMLQHVISMGKILFKSFQLPKYKTPLPANPSFRPFSPQTNL